MAKAIDLLNEESSLGEPPPRIRCKLVTIADVRHELARLYRQAKGGSIDIADSSRLGNLLSILGRLIEGSEIERRLRALEEGDDHAPA